MSIGKNIKKYRLENKITQTDLGKSIDRSLSVIQKYEAGDIIPSINVIEKIAKVLNIDSTKLYLDEGIAELEKKYNGLLERYNEIVNENNSLKAELKDLQEQNSINYDLIKYQREKITELENRILSHD